MKHVLTSAAQDLSEIAVELGIPACSVDRFVADPESGMTLPNPAIVPNFTHLVPPEGHDWIYPFTTLPHYHSQNAGPWCRALRCYVLAFAMSICATGLGQVHGGAMGSAHGSTLLRMAVGRGAGISTRRCATGATQCPQLRKQTLCLCTTTGGCSPFWAMCCQLWRPAEVMHSGNAGFRYLILCARC